MMSRHHTAIFGPCPPPGVGVVCGIVPAARNLQAASL
jgi:hypothetical protein